jgi:phosphoribosyl 1,2-cyclic phosphodiesterase
MNHNSPTIADPSAPDSDSLALCVLSSSSAGNCSALLYTRNGERSLFLIDLGLTPRRTFRHLAEVGLAGVPIAGALLTHLDTDHCKATWAGLLPESTRLYVHRRHRGRAEREGFLYRRCEVFDGPFALAPGLEVRPLLQSHDELGVVTYRFEQASREAALGFATDVGHATEELVRHLSGVHTLAIESNYCPRLQAASSRPEFLKRRIMGGSGHLSNRECATATQQIAPSKHVVLLHLSRECNTPELAGLGHRGRGYAVTTAEPDRPTDWIRIEASEAVKA